MEVDAVSSQTSWPAVVSAGQWNENENISLYRWHATFDS